MPLFARACPVVLCLALALPVGAQGVEQLDAFMQPATVLVETNLPDGMLYAGETLLGRVGDGAFEIPAGAHRLVLREANPEAWRLRTAETTVEVTPGEHVTVRLDVPTRYRIESFPFGAVVTLEGEGGVERLGVTPLDLDVEAPLVGTLIVEKAGYAVAEQAPGAAADNRYQFVLRPFDPVDATGEIALGPERAPNYWIDAAAVGLALGAGAVAVYYKFKGDDEYEAYARSGGDPALRDGFERYDTYSAIALGAMQVGIGVFAIRLVLR